MIQAEPIHRIAVLEDDPHVLAHFVDIISASPTLEICATASTIAER